MRDCPTLHIKLNPTPGLFLGFLEIFSKSYFIVKFHHFAHNSDDNPHTFSS